MTRFAKFALSTATALGLAIAPIPAAAQPGGEDFARVIAGIAVLGVIAKIADDRNNNRRNTVTSSGRTPQFGSIDDRHRPRVIEGDIRRPNNYSHKTQGYKKAPLPQSCLLIAATGRGDRYVYGERCLNRNFKHASKLPARCERVIRTNRGARNIYFADCLARDGWRVANRR